jgi:hypothetical protein
MKTDCRITFFTALLLSPHASAADFLLSFSNDDRKWLFPATASALTNKALIPARAELVKRLPLQYFSS